MSHPTIALLTDFGLQDNYVGIMKCVISKLCPRAQIIDLCHNVPPQSLVSGAYQLSSAVPYLKEGTILTAVIDPGVGGGRKAVAIDTGSFICVGPDNGLFDMVLKKSPAQKVVELNNPDFHLEQVSSTFHGRDIFAPAAGHLAAGAQLESLGDELDPSELEGLAPTSAFLHQSRVECHVIHVDRFGNLITNLSDDELNGWLDDHAPSIEFRDTRLRLQPTFSSVPKGRPLAYFGSAGQLEIGVRDGSAARYFDATQGSTVFVRKA